MIKVKKVKLDKDEKKIEILGLLIVALQTMNCLSSARTKPDQNFIKPCRISRSTGKRFWRLMKR